jgi:NAD(P)-dependent dehydrogenase (short-subunit alcohol dehydrogenase family)
MSPVVMVTGATGNLGRVVVDRFLRRGYRTILFDRRSESLAQTFPELVGSADHILVGELDLTDRAAVHATVDAAVAKTGQLDALVHTVGMFKGDVSIHETDNALVQTLLSVNVLTTLWCSQAALPHMRRLGAGAIVNVASTAALEGEAGLGAYSATKAAVVRLTESLAKEVGRDGINVNAVLPGTMDTPNNRAAMPGGTFIPIGAVADAVVFLTSPAGRGVHGVAVPVLGRRP